MSAGALLTHIWLTFILVITLVCCVRFKHYFKVNTYVHSDTIYANATRDVSLLGEYSFKTSVSIRYWLYAIEVAIWKKDESFNAIHLFRTWNAECNDDFAGFIYNGLEKAHSLFLCELEKARKEEREPVFAVSDDYDFHNCPKSLLYSDHVATDELLNRVDELIGGEALG